MDVPSFLLFTLFIVIAASIAKKLKGRSSSYSNLPPGPFRLPVIGNLHLIGPKPHKSLAKLAQTYGPIMSLKLGQVTTIVISSASAARLVMKKHDQAFANRSIPDLIHACNHDEVSVVWMPFSRKWRELRKILNSEIFSSARMDANASVRQQKVAELIASIEKSCSLGEAVVIGDAMFNTSLNLLSSVILSMNIADGSSKAATEFKESVCSILQLAGMPNLADFYPWLRVFDPQLFRSWMGFHFGKMLKFVDSIIDRRLAQKADGGYVSHNNDMLDTLLNLMLESNGEFTRNDINHLFLDLIVAGTDTTSSTLEWALSEVLKNPKILQRAKAELDEFVGKGKLIRDADISRLPYLQAIIKETLRLHSPGPFIPRKAFGEIQLDGYTVPIGAQILINVWAIGRDSNTWDDADCFKPERFLGTDVDFRGGNFELIPFGGGRRICPGLVLASRMLHLILGSLLNTFDWKLEGDANPIDIDMDDKFGFSLPRAQPLRVIPVRLGV